MQLLSSVSALLAVLPVALGVDKDPYRTSAGALASNYPGGLDFYSNCWKFKGCDWEDAVDLAGAKIPGARQCSCNANPDGWDDLIWFYTKTSFTGDLYKGFGHWGECQDLPTLWKRKTESVQINTTPDLLCCLYTQPGCAKTGEWHQRDGSNPAEQSIKEFQGLYYKGVQSFKCSEKFNSSSTCNFP